MASAFRDALEGRTEKLYGQLATASGLPGPRANLALANAFAAECVAIGPAADALAFSMARLSPDEAPGASAREFLPVCGIFALGGRAAEDEAIRARVVLLLHAAAEDPRFRVRDAVPSALSRIGERSGSPLVVAMKDWTNGFHQAAAALLALANAGWLSALAEATPVLERLDEAFLLARDAPRAAARWPGWKALVDALASAPAGVATRFGVPVFDLLVRWAATEIPELREAIERNLGSRRLAGRYSAEIERVRAALAASAPVPRDPTLIVHGMRGRGRKRRR